MTKPTIKPTILVMTAAGGTGYPTALDLLSRGFPVRAFVHRPSARADGLKAAGAEIFVGNQLDIRDLRRAFHGVHRAYFNQPVGPNALYANVAMAAVAQEARLETATFMSQWHPDPTHPAVFSREEWLSARVVDWLPGVDMVTVNPGFFAENYLPMIEPAAQMGMMMAPFGEGKNAPPSNADMGRVIAATLADPAPHIGKTYRPTGPKLLDPSEIAAAIGRVVGRKVRYMDAPDWMFTKAALAMGFTPSMLISGVHYMQEYRRGTYAIGAPTSVVEDVTGQPAEDFEMTVRRWTKDLRDAKPSFFGMLRGMGFMMKTMLTHAPNLSKYARNTNAPIVDSPVYAQDSEEWRRTHDQAYAGGAA